MVQNMAMPKRIVDCKVQDGKKLFHVKWSSSWEPEENLSSFQNLIDDFWDFIDNCRYANGLCPKPAKKRRVDGTPVKPPPNQQMNAVEQAINANQPIQNVGIPRQIAAQQYQQMQQFQMNNNNNGTRTPLNQQLTFNQMQNVQQPTLQQNLQVSTIQQTVPQSPTQQTMSYSPMQQINTPPNFMRQTSNPNTTNQEIKVERLQQKIKEEVDDVKPTNLCAFQNMQSPFDQKQFNFGSPQGNRRLSTGSGTGSPSRGRGRGRGRGASVQNGTNISTFGASVKEEEGIMKSEEMLTQSSVKKPNTSSNTENWSNPYTKVAYICRYCSKPQPTSNKQNWKSHYESHFDIKNFGCYICEKRFRLKGDLKRHITNVHTEVCIEERILKFDDKIQPPFIDPSEENIDGLQPNEYVRHVFLCKECDKVLAWKSKANWKSHYESHLNIKKFACYVCMQRFRLKGDLKRHVENVHKEVFESERVIFVEQ